ncbi:hypothetical protein B0J13DRAFT_527916 [Dactylonectria estremocensis]|uniref:Uncharacterized protein n=1 Tax=Dactylonectria estremocensis TaxID=1079267 RepID=A0A9P9EHL3_9HYPO|nr:hypothetical protein B0J13DRAFT_527916 [Dactylonectria estremocensis]
MTGGPSNANARPRWLSSEGSNERVLGMRVDKMPAPTSVSRSDNEGDNGHSVVLERARERSGERAVDGANDDGKWRNEGPRRATGPRAVGYWLRSAEDGVCGPRVPEQSIQVAVRTLRRNLEVPGLVTAPGHPRSSAIHHPPSTIQRPSHKSLRRSLYSMAQGVGIGIKDPDRELMEGCRRAIPCHHMPPRPCDAPSHPLPCLARPGHAMPCHARPMLSQNAPQDINGVLACTLLHYYMLGMSGRAVQANVQSAARPDFARAFSRARSSPGARVGVP